MSGNCLFKFRIKFKYIKLTKFQPKNWEIWIKPVQHFEQFFWHNSKNLIDSVLSSWNNYYYYISKTKLPLFVSQAKLITSVKKEKSVSSIWKPVFPNLVLPNKVACSRDRVVTGSNISNVNLASKQIILGYSKKPRTTTQAWQESNF